MNYLQHVKQTLSVKKKSAFLNPIVMQLLSRRHYPEPVKRFYKNVTVAGIPQCYEVNLDHRKLKTPFGNVLQVPTYPLALAIANEWSSVDVKIIPAWMHLTGLSCTVFDNPQKLTRPLTVDKILDYIETDTLLFPEYETKDFINLQTKEWNPILEWFNGRFDVNLEPSKGIGAANVSEDCKHKIRKYLLSYNIWAISGILYGVEALKSVILTAATLERKITPEKAVYLTLLETEYQVERWGSVEWYHGTDKLDLLSRFSASVLFVHLNTSDYFKKQKGSLR